MSLDFLLIASGWDASEAWRLLVLNDMLTRYPTESLAMLPNLTTGLGDGAQSYVAVAVGCARQRVSSDAQPTPAILAPSTLEEQVSKDREAPPEERSNLL